MSEGEILKRVHHMRIGVTIELCLLPNDCYLVRTINRGIYDYPMSPTCFSIALREFESLDKFYNDELLTLHDNKG